MFDIRTLSSSRRGGHATSALLPLVFADPGAGLSGRRRERNGHGMGRRDFGGLAAAAAVAASCPPGVTQPGVNSSHLRYWEHARMPYAHDRAVGGPVLFRPALRQWQRVRKR